MAHLKSVLFTIALAGTATVLVAQQSPRIPLRPGLTIVTALNEPSKGDYESIKLITKVGADELLLQYSADVPVSDEDNPFAARIGGGSNTPAKPPNGKKMRQVSATRRVKLADLKTSHEYRSLFADGQSEFYPGSTAVSLSASVLNELKSKGETHLSIPERGIAGALGSLLGNLLGGSKDLASATMRSGTLKRVERGTVPFKVLVNDRPVELAAIHARGQIGDAMADFWILDDPDNPLALKWDLGDWRLQVIKLSFGAAMEGESPAAGAKAGGAGKGAGGGAPAGSTGADRIEEALEKEGRAVVYGIYFDFDSDRIKPQSEPVLREIAQVLGDNPGWSLAIEGHTDNIGGDSYNLDLSKRRAAAVRQALMAQHKIEGKRLQTNGFGASVPKDRNDTMEGRARNRRVELVRQ